MSYVRSSMDGGNMPIDDKIIAVPLVKIEKHKVKVLF